MTFKAFIFGLLASFGLPWLVVVLLPYSAMRSLPPVEYGENDQATGSFIPKRDGRVTEGSLIYGQEGCATCHTQVIRPSYAGNDVFRAEWAGLRKTANHPDTRRETLAMDFADEQVAHIGMSRVGPDLSNLGRRLEAHLAGTDDDPESWVLRHLYNPRGLENYRVDSQDLRENSSCPSKRGLFKEVDVYGGGGGLLPVEITGGKGIKPTDRAKALAGYLVSLKKDNLGQELPEALNFNPQAPAEAE